MILLQVFICQSITVELLPDTSKTNGVLLVISSDFAVSRRAERRWRQLRSDYTAARRAVGNQVLLRKLEFYGGQVASYRGDQKKLCCLMNNLMG